MNEDKHMCPVCGWIGLEYDPGERTYEICPCCGIEFGYDVGVTWEHLRNLWIKQKKMSWWSKSTLPPADWDPLEQVQNLR